MKTAFLLQLALVPWLASDHARGLQLMQEGKFAEAAKLFAAATVAEPTNAELHYNLALALWRAGKPHEAEIAAEKAATLSDGKLAPLRDGILGNLKVDEAKGKLGGEQPDLQAALAAATSARDHFLHGAAAAGAPGELARNLERTLKLIADIEKKIEEQKQQQKDDKKDQDKKDQDKKDQQSKDGEQKDGDDKDKKEKKDKDDQQQKPSDDKDKKSDSKPESKPKDQSDDEKEQEQQSEQDTPPPGKGENKDKPEPKPEPQAKPEAKDKGQPPPQPEPGEQQDKPEPQPAPGAEDKDAKADAKPQAMLGQPQPGKELSPEETKRLLDKLQAILVQKAELEKAQQAARPKVKKDW